MANYPNQQKININIDKTLHHSGDGKDFLLSINWEAFDIAHSILNNSEFELFTYFFRWAGTSKKDNNGYYFSPAGIFYDTNISESTSHRIKKHFVELGYLVKTSKNCYDFDPIPEAAKRLAKEKKAERILKQKGEIDDSVQYSF